MTIRLQAACGVLAITLAALLAGCGSGPLSASTPAEVALRSARLAGFESTTVGEQGDVAWIWLRMRGVNSAGDIEAALQTGFATLAVSHEDARTYRVRIAISDDPVLQIEAAGETVRTAVDDDDIETLRRSLSYTYLPGQASLDPPDYAMTAGVDVTEAYLDAKNRAAGILGAEDGPDALAFARLDRRWRWLNDNVAGRPAITGESVGEVYAQEIAAGLGGIAEGEEELIARVEDVISSEASDRYWILRSLAMVVEAVNTDASYGGLLGPVATLAHSIEETGFASGPLSDALLVAAHDPDAPDEMRVVELFDREPQADITPDSAGGQSIVLGLDVSDGSWVADDGSVQHLVGQEWIGYRRADGTLYWLGTEQSQYALVLEPVDGWAFSRPVIAIVDPEDVGVHVGAIDVTGLVYGNEE